ncbi:MAG: hypothetical protein K9M96_17940 [Deltaproteobacteria bacterium]|nr:hypothetical protein [Deltaproteobacteria bacterium]
MRGGGGALYPSGRIGSGSPHQDLGEEIAAAVILKPGLSGVPDELRQFVKQEVAP